MQGQRPRLRGHLRGLVLPALRGLQDRARDRRGQHAARSTRSRSTREQRGELVLPPVGVPGAARAAVRRAPGLRAAARRATTRRSSFIERRPAGRLARRARSSSWGVPVPWDPEPRLLRLVRRAPQLLHGALASRATGEDLTDRFWPATLHLIGKDILKFHTVFWPAMLMAAGPAAARARLRPRLPADGRARR